MTGSGSSCPARGVSCVPVGAAVSPARSQSTDVTGYWRYLCTNCSCWMMGDTGRLQTGAILWRAPRVPSRFFSLDPIKLPCALPAFLLPFYYHSCCLRYWLWFGHSLLLTW